MFQSGTYPLVGRFSLGSAQPTAPDPATRVRGFAFDIVAPGGAEWRSAMIDLPFFPVGTPSGFLALLQAQGSADKDVAIGRVAAAHPELKQFGAWAKTAPWTASFAEERYNGLDAFVATDAAGARHAVRWSLLPTTPVAIMTPAALQARGPDFLDQDLRTQLATGPLRWTLVLTEAAPGDPTADPSQAWPADRPTITAGTVQPISLTLVSIHRPLGIAILLLAIVRLALRARRGTPPLPLDLPSPMRLGATLSHWALYSAMIAMLLIGWAMVSAAGLPVVMGGGVHLPPILPQSNALHAVLWDAHRVIAYLLFGLVLLHLSAALVHALIRRDGVFQAMAGGSPPA